MQSQKQQILKHLKRGKSITALQALNKYGCLRLASRINEIKQEGYTIVSKMVTRGSKRLAEYRMV